jgi:HAE1 family hydrophobic/amphiphilic exporter-1
LTAGQPSGIAVVGGLVFSQLLILYIIPAFFVSMELFLQKKKQRSQQQG